MFKNKIFNYFFLEFFKIFLLITFSLSVLIWMTQAARLLELITEFGNPISVYIKYLFAIYPKILSNIFLLCFTISMFFLFTSLESSKELQIYWLSGISKNKVINASLKLSIIAMVLYFFLVIFFAPWSSLQGRYVLGKSEFSIINSLVKQNNFNSPLKDLTIYVSKNDQKGNLNDVFIYEKKRTIIAKKGQILSLGDNFFLQLYDGISQEKNNSKINIVKFKETIFDFSKYKIKNTDYPKFSERDILWLIKRMNGREDEPYIKKNQIEEIRQEINKRLINPFFILIITVLSCFLIKRNNEKFSNKKFKFIIYLVTIFFLILNQILLGLSGTKIFYSFFYLFIIFFIFTSLLIYLRKNLG